MEWTRSIGLALVVAAACGRGTAPPPPDPRLAQWRTDVAHLAAELPARHHQPFFRVPEATWRADLAKLEAELPALSDDQIVTRLAQTVASLGDGHTRLALAGGEQYAIRLQWFDDGLFLLATPPGENWAVANEIVAIGGVPTPAALDRLATVAPHDNASQRRNEAIGALLQPPFVRGLGLAGAGGELTLTMRTADGERPLVLRPGRARPSWGPATIPPLARSAPGQTYWARYLPPVRALFVQYNACAESKPPFAEFVASLGQVIAAEKVERIVVDLRSNGGGDSRIFAPFLALVAAHPELRVFVLIGRATFSSAVLNALELEAAGAMLVGEMAGGAPSHHGEVKSFVLPGHRHTVFYSTKFFANPRHPGSELVPSLAVPVLASDYFAGKDPALDAALTAP